jgi:hypothetical protein
MTPRRSKLELTPENCRGLRNLYLDTDWGQLDCLGNVLGVGDFEEVLRASMSIRLPFGTCRVLTISALINAKSAMDRPRDRETVEQLTIIRRRTRKSRRSGPKSNR